MNQAKFKTPFLAITGGKGGTGKTLIATNLAVQFANEGKHVLLVDCDVENPNTHILLNKTLTDPDVNSKKVNLFLPIIDKSICTKCGKCHSACYRHAILQLPLKFPSIMEHLCSGCEICMKICPVLAITPGFRSIGTQYSISNVCPGLDLFIGEMNPSEALSALIVKEILANVSLFNSLNHYDVIILDTSPGAHCDVEQVISAADLILCVTEPTPFGEHDLARILELVRIIQKRAYILLNRSNMTDYRDPINLLAQKYDSQIIGEIPLDVIVIENNVKGIPFVNDSRIFPAKQCFFQIYEYINAMLKDGQK